MYSATCVSLIFLICRRSKLCSDLMSLYYIFKMQSTFFQSLQITMAAIGGADGNGGDDNGGFDDELRSLPLFTQVYRFLPKATCSALCPPCLCVLAALSVRCVRPVCACWPPCPCVASALSVCWPPCLCVGRPVRALRPPCLCVLAALSVCCVRPVCACWPPCPCVVSALSVRVGRPVGGGGVDQLFYNAFKCQL